MAEQWTFNADNSSAAVTGRTAVSLLKKINPLWWFGNDQQPDPPGDYLPTYPSWLRIVFWYLRNPLSNFNNYVVGVLDRNFTVTGVTPIMVTDWINVDGRVGYKWNIVWVAIPLPFISYTGKKRSILGNRRILWHIGWQPWGDLAAKFNITTD